MSRNSPRTLEEACRCTQFWGLTPNRGGSSLDSPQDDFVAKYREFRDKCPERYTEGHDAFCSRCDNSYPSEVGGADYLRRQGVVVRNPFEKFPQPLLPREGPKISPSLRESLGSFISTRVPLAPKDLVAKIKGLSELSVQEDDPMADTEATRALFRQLLGMTSGGTTGGRQSMTLPDEMMDAMSGDAAQETLARENLIMEMRRQKGAKHDPRYVGLDLMEMEADNVDQFLATARKKIMKRGKGSRKACCSKIGGILDQMMGPMGGEYADKEEPTDRGQADPIGDVDKVERTFKMVKEDENLSDDLLGLIAEEFSHYEHSNECAFADPKFYPFERGPLGEQEHLLQTRRPGLLRNSFNLSEGAGLPMDKAKSALAMLKQKKAAGKLAGKEAALLPRLAAYIKSGGGDAEEKQEESHNMESSRTANALSGFMEVTEAVNCYKAASAGSGKGSPDSGKMGPPSDAGDLSLKTRADNAEYPTELMPAKSGGKKTAGQPQSLSTRGKDRGDPIGEDAVEGEDGPRISETAGALANFMEANGQYASAKKRLALKSDKAGDLGLSERSKQRLGRPLESAKKVRSKIGKPRYDPKLSDDDLPGDADESQAGASKLKK